MKKLLLLISLCLSLPSFAYDSNKPAEEVAKDLLNTDCALSAEDCRYYVAIEYIAYKNACLKILNASVIEIKNANAWVDEWSYLRPEALKLAVLNPDNKFIKVYEKNIYEYLTKLPTNEVGIECSRLLIIKDNYNPEEYSDILTKTLNYKKPVKTTED